MKVTWTLRVCLLACLFWKTASSETEYPKLIGCFSDSYVKRLPSFIGTILNGDLFGLCHEQMSLYSAMSEDGDFCGDDIPYNSEAVNSSLCLPCVFYSEMYCGGNGYISVYQIRETVQRPLLMATDSGVIMISAYNASITSKVTDGKALAVDYFFRYQEYYKAENTIIAVRNHLNIQKADKIGDYLIEDLAVDWENFNQMYWSCKGVDKIFSLNSWTYAFKTNGTPGDLALDPYQRLLFFIDNGTVVSYNLDADEVTRRYVFGGSVVRMCIDHYEELVFGIVDINNESSLLITDYNNTMTTLVFSGPELTNSVKMRVFHGELVWIARDQKNYTLYLCKLSPKCKRAHLTMVWQTTEKLNDVKFYNSLVQTPSIRFACKVLNCSHICIDIHMYDVECACPPDMTLLYEQTCLESSVELSERSSSVTESSVDPSERPSSATESPPTGFYYSLTILLAVLPLVSQTI